MKSGEEMYAKPFEGKRILVTGGTGSLGKVLIPRLLNAVDGDPAKIIVFSRDEAKQHQMRLEYQNKTAATEEVIYHNFQQKLEFRIGDVRDHHSVEAVMPDVDIVFNAAALKQVPTCEYFPYESVKTNIEGAENIVRAIQKYKLQVEAVIGISTDKACKPVNVMGMSKAIQERIFIQANMRCPRTRFVCARYGNVLASRGSVIPLFQDQIRRGGPVTITSPEMTRFLLSLEEAVDTVFAAVREGLPGETFIPRVRSALVVNLARALIGGRDIKLEVSGTRPGEKLHESLVSEEEALRTVNRGNYYVIQPMLPEVAGEGGKEGCLQREYSSADNVMDFEQTVDLLKKHHLMVEDMVQESVEVLR
jgi:UDP-glucose 4-epimerase